MFYFFLVPRENLKTCWSSLFGTYENLELFLPGWLENRDLDIVHGILEDTSMGSSDAGINALTLSATRLAGDACTRRPRVFLWPP